MKRGRTSKRALSTVVSTGILLSAVAIMGSMLVSWSTSSFAVHQQELDAVYSDNINKLNEFLVIENVWFGQTPSKFLNVTIANVGNIGLNVTKINLDDSVTKLETKISNGGISPDDHYSSNMTYAWQSSIPVEITVTTDRGAIYKTLVMAP